MYGNVAWSSGFAILLRDVRNYYRLFIKVLRLKLFKKGFPLLGICRSWEVFSFTAAIASEP